MRSKLRLWKDSANVETTAQCALSRATKDPAAASRDKQPEEGSARRAFELPSPSIGRIAWRDLYKAAVDAVCCGLEADRASILTCDEKMVMRFQVR